MKLFNYFIFVFCCLISTFSIGQKLNSQQSSLMFGIHTNVNMNLVDGYPIPLVNYENIPRYGAGLVLRQSFKQNHNILKFGKLQGKGNFYMDYGLNFNTRAYGYLYKEEDITHNQYYIELPVILGLKAANNYLSKGWKRRNINGFVSTGLKFAYSPKLTFEQTMGNIDNNDYVLEEGEIGGLNLLVATSYGLMRTLQNGDISAVSFTVNIGTIASGNTTLSLYHNGKMASEKIAHKGGYLSIDLYYFFARQLHPDRITPVIFCPGF